MNLRKYMHACVALCMLAGSLPLMMSCADEDMSKSLPDYDPRYKGTVAFGSADYNIGAEAQEVKVSFRSDQKWKASLETSAEDGEGWATLVSESGTEADSVIIVRVEANENTANSRKAVLTIETEKGTAKSVTIAQNYKVVMLQPKQIADYAKYICPSTGNAHFEKGAEFMLRQDAYYSWHRMRQSEHFFVFWSPEFGDDPNGAHVKESMRVDVDDLLRKAEQFFYSNVNLLGMARLGEGKSMLDDYKMQIYLIYQDEWLATGAGYDNKIGALWVNPSTCQPVGSTIAHEIGHSFQYQVYADKIQKQGQPDDLHHGFRYGFGENGAGGNAYWEQCAQWQAHIDYPNEMFDYHLNEWKRNYHRHFNHAFMRYSNYFLQHLFVEKHGIDTYGRIWRESEYPEDPLQTYCRLYCNNDQNLLYAELYEYASRMVCYDLKYVHNTGGEVTVPTNIKGDYATELYKVGDQRYQVGYASCPGTTGFNIIKLKTPAPGARIAVDVEALKPGSPLVKGDKGEVKDADGKVVNTTRTYNQQANQSVNYRCGYVAIVGGKPVYSTMFRGEQAGVGVKGAAEYTVPEGTEELYFVIQAAPETYNRCAWNSDESNDEQWPYAISLRGTDVASYVEVVDIHLDPNSKPTDAMVTINQHCTAETAYAFAKINLAYVDNAAIPYAFCLMPDELQSALIASTAELTEGKVRMRLKQPDGTYTTTNNTNGQYAGFWCDATGMQQNWGAEARTCTELNSITEMSLSCMPGAIKRGESYPQVLELQYMKDGKIYTVTIHLNIIID